MNSEQTSQLPLPRPLPLVDLEQVKRRLYKIVIEGNDNTAVQAARVLLRDVDNSAHEGVDTGMLDELWITLKSARSNHQSNE